MTEYTKLTEVQKNSIANYLQSRLGVYGVKSWDFAWEISKTNDKEFATQDITLSNIGIFKHILRHCTLKLEIWSVVNENKHVNLSLQYQNFSFGQNGQNLDFELIVHDDGSVYEKGV